jgi:hypothetical protein
MTTLRVLTDEGTNRFREYLLALRENPDLPSPRLDSPSDSAPFHKYLEIDDERSFSTRMELAEYLLESFERAGLGREDVIQHYGMWTWLASVWFDVICPPSNGGRRVRQGVRYICSSNYRHYYRHYIAAAYAIYSIHGPENSRLFLDCQPDVHNDFVEQLASRPFMIGNTHLIELAHRLFWDSLAKRAKPAASDRKKPGNLRRLIKVIGQLELTYDIHTMESEKVVGLLPPEFKMWVGRGH